MAVSLLRRAADGKEAGSPRTQPGRCQLKTTADVWRRQPCGTDRRNSNEIPVAHSIVTCHVPPVQEGTGTHMAMAFQRPIKPEAKLRLAIIGPAGSGKTYTARSLARTLAAPRLLAALIA